MLNKDIKIVVETNEFKRIKLSENELIVLRYTWAAKTAQEIENLTGIPKRTVNGLIQSAKKKTGYDRTIIVIRHCIKDGLISWRRSTKPMFKLTGWEIEAIQGVYDGLTLEESGAKYFRSRRAMQSRIDSAKEKTGIKETLLLVRYALDKGLVN